MQASKNSKKDLDKTIVELYKTDQNKAFGMLMQQYQQSLYWHIRKILISHDDTDDALQNTFVKAWKSLAKFRGDSKLYTWLYRIATNEAITLLNKNKTKITSTIDDNENLLAETLTSDEYFSGDEIQRKLQKAILTLPEKQRIVFNMKYFDEIKYQDMSEILGTSVGALKASYHHAVKKIELILSED